jgi:SAM-dependent methyltransferase
VEQPLKDTIAPGWVSDGRLNRLAIPPRPTGLHNISIQELTGELVARINEGAFSKEATILFGWHIQDALEVALDVHCNRMSRRRYRDLFGTFYEWVGPPRPYLEDTTIVELGCGSINPYGFLFLFLMLGARRGIAVDRDAIQDISRSVRHVADCAGMMFTDPKQLVGDYPITRQQVLQNISSFDLAKLNAGDTSGIDIERLYYCQDPMEALSLRDGEADLVISNATLEHIEDVAATIEEMARITRKGGFGIHNIDAADHHRYWDPTCHPLEFLTSPGDEPLVHSSNRIRPAEFCALFECHGFEIVEFTPYETVAVDATFRERLIEPFRAMPDEVLTIIGAKLVVRRV